MAKVKKHGKKKLSLTRKLARALTRTTLAEIQENLGATLTIRRIPGAPNFQCFLSNTFIKKNGANHSSGGHLDCYGVGDTPSKATRNLAGKLREKTLYPMDRGPCRDGKKEMVILGEVLPI